MSEYADYDLREREMENEAAEREQRTFGVIEWANLYGDDLAGALRLDEHDDAETLSIIEDALWCAWKLDALSRSASNQDSVPKESS